MANVTNEEASVRDRAALFWGIGIGAVVGGAVMYFWLMGAGTAGEAPKRYELFAALGDAIAPFAAILSAAALFAAIDGVRLQREELTLQRRDLAESREVMKEQARAAERSAETQERLAAAQDALAKRQAEANAIAYQSQLASLRAAEVTLRARLVEFENNLQPPFVAQGLRPLQAKLESVVNHFTEQGSCIVQRVPARDSTTQQPRQPLDE